MLDRNQALWLPVGSIRAIIALMLVIALVVLVLTGRPIPENVAVLVVGVVAFYFGGKATSDAGENATRNVERIAAAQSEVRP